MQAKTTKVVEDEELKALLATSANPKKAKKKKKETEGGYPKKDRISVFHQTVTELR